MRDDAPDWVIHESHSVRTYVDALYDGDLIAEDIPLDAGTLDVTADVPVPGRLDLSFPSMWAPRTATAPLAIYGQRLSVRQVLKVGQQEWTVYLGDYLVQGWDHEAPSVSVEALSLEQLIVDFQFTQPFNPPSGATFASTLTALCNGVLAVDTSAMTDAPLADVSAAEWTQDRMAAVQELADAWPADLRVDVDGILVATPKATVKTTPDVEWTHGEANAYVSVGGSGLRDDIFNCIVVTGQNANNVDIRQMAKDLDPASPTYWGGPFGRRVRYEANNLPGQTKASLLKTAKTYLAKERRKAAVVTVTAPPDPRIETGDTARVTLDDGRTYLGLVTDISLPLTPVEGAATYSVGIDRVL